ncbi:uncharacterized protein SPPG_09147 [Spizellomyces punctatus DAOM BR117]|uniref:MYND-type domain-containing protein n=1 Tax=Spizellomyces punctatus (strain DAOM BR117) TaxID=645134 RepID=A0A0L0HIK7_SPIPD|nr:uncharacterized protein SPPG_09147 [Spizellomyces punctatus DAOM BR117]KND00705.1 hypothetical protein SPPG_09147 [Spizellomyces punctatus DAOM BR117]|eukprot:XP_016608744.1 hypothetical protein SPPG_09147 [Spizellomyces punctatus DAOM BR117]
MDTAISTQQALREQHLVGKQVKGAKHLLEVEETSERGRGIFARENLSAGTTLLEERAYATVVDDKHLQSHCSLCFSPNARFRCSKCTLLHYCSQTCQRKDWTLHRSECACFRRIAPRRPPTAIRALCRLLWVRQKYPNSFDAINALQSHSLDYSKEKLETFAQMAALIRTIIGEESCLPPSEMIDLLCRFSCNSISVSDGELVNIGVGVFPVLSLVNHSCSPNAAIIFNGERATLRAIKNIQVDEEICQSYMEIAEPRYVRRKELKETYFFDCRCPLCLRYDQTADPRTTYNCVSSGCAGFIDLPDQLENATCSVHGRLSADLEAKLTDEVTKAFRLYRKAAEESDPDRALSTGLACLRLQSKLMHPANSEMIRTRRLVLDLLLSRQRWEEAYKVSHDLLDAYQALYEQHHPSISVQAYMTYKLAEWCHGDDIQLLCAKISEAVQLLLVSHGDGQALTKEAKQASENCIIRRGSLNTFG